jgi:hypothetical protein
VQTNVSVPPSDRHRPTVGHRPRRQYLVQDLNSTSRVVSEAFRKPERLNCAGYCNWCCQPDCWSVRCIELDEASVYVVCPQCDGSETWEELPCRGCHAGVIQIDSGTQPYTP